MSITASATGFHSGRKRDGARLGGAAPADVNAALRAGRENRDYLRELDQQRAAAPVPAQAEVTSGAAPMAESQAPIYQPAPQAPASNRPAQEVEDLDIPAFLRRNSGR